MFLVAPLTESLLISERCNGQQRSHEKVITSPTVLKLHPNCETHFGDYVLPTYIQGKSDIHLKIPNFIKSFAITCRVEKNLASRMYVRFKGHPL